MTEKKHLFGTTEKSDFILNMTEQGTKKLCGMYCIIAMLLLTIAAIPYYLTKDVVDYVDNVSGMENTHMWSEKAIYWMSTLMMGIGIIGLCIFLIGKMKEEIVLKDNKALLWMAGIFLTSLISSLCAESLSYAFTGYFDRSEGLLSIVGYIGFFAAAMTVTDNNWRKRVSDFIVGIGAFQSIVGILQNVPVLRSKIPNYFAYLFSHYGTDLNEGERIINLAVHTSDYSASGFACTPFALAAILTVTFAVAASGFVFDESKVRKVFYGVAALLMTACAVLTDVTPAIIGLGVAALAVFVVSVVSRIRNKDEYGGAVIVRAGVLIVAAAAVVGIMALCGLFGLKDEQVIFTDTFDRLSISISERSDTSMWIYPYLWDDGLYVFQNNILLGTGPDNWGTMYSLGSTVDRSYNEYIDVAMQRGIITVALYLIFLVITLKKAICALGRFIKKENNWVAAAVCCAVIAYMVQAFFNISSISSSPFFYIVMGLIWSYTAKKIKLEKQA